ncbi:GNAT family N-acetyltransferase [Terrisporobacter vanillatitrophus]|uniref:GNAT family N-acetyltransferase n=1 Tax=Terrisporobacter vanillatitrophus TaxID=3058402 RepID=UPI003368B147
MDYFIRKMDTHDWLQVKEIYRQGIDTNMGTFQTCIPDYEEWDNAHLKDGRYVVVNNDKVVGWVALTPISSRCVYDGVAEISVYIHNDYKRKGIGYKLLTKLVDESEKLGIWTLQSGIFQDNLASIELHKKCGFREVGYREKIGKDKFGNWRNTILMEKRNNIE